MTSLHAPLVESIYSARERLAGTILRTPLIPFAQDEVEIYLKLENLQPTGSFKVRGAGNALLAANPDQLQNGVWTASAGNMGQALAWYAKKLNVPCTVLVPEDAPEVKVQAIQRLGAEVVKVPFAEYQSVQKEGSHPAMKGLLIHPFADEAVMAGNGMIGLEILEDLPDVDLILVPYGGGGLSCGIAAAVRAERRDERSEERSRSALSPSFDYAQDEIRVEAVELETATPFTSSLSAGKMVEVPYQASFVSGMGAPFVFPQMWTLASQLLAGSRVVELPQVAEAIRLLAERHHIIVEGAGAVALAAALQITEKKKVVCVVSGGNINAAHLNKILQGELP
ncbi:MAG: pyridoxal-phosphate dependent enzyme [Chloroflexi bacterium]|nr:pyridoxal-phosphate dependent enzyme [Chloroflexota bacterium]